jgi:hypothetical protein
VTRASVKRPPVKLWQPKSNTIPTAVINCFMPSPIGRALSIREQMDQRKLANRFFRNFGTVSTFGSLLPLLESSRDDFQAVDETVASFSLELTRKHPKHTKGRKSRRTTTRAISKSGESDKNVCACPVSLQSSSKHCCTRVAMEPQSKNIYIIRSVWRRLKRGQIIKLRRDLQPAKDVKGGEGVTGKSKPNTGDTHSTHSQ